jgi:pimeloyl-ACP methyl ester carboxylesterase
MVRREDGALVMRERGEISLGIGRLSFEVETNDFQLSGYELYHFAPVTELEVKGFRNRYRRAGIGAPLAARARPLPGTSPPIQMGENARVPVTALLEIENPLAGLRSRELHARLHLFASLEVDEAVIGDRRVPIEAEPTAALAAGLTESRFWEQEIQLFLGNSLGLRRSSGLGALRPYQKGRIPAVFVHGTASSPARWADMVNDLLADPGLRHRYAFWFFWYDSGNPIAYSGWRLREALTKAVTGLDPSGTDPCLQDLVVLGHSQGGLLTKLTAIDSGDSFWRHISTKPFEEVQMGEEDKALLRNALFVRPLPFVKRVLFLATPHQGSYLAGPQLVRRLAERLVRLPSDVARLGADLAQIAPTAALTGERIPTSIDNMSPGNRFIRALSEIPVAPGIAAHSIVAVDADDPLDFDTVGDGVVKYRSAHVEGVESELIVRSVHSGMQAQAATIEEVRRIFVEHSAASACPMPPRPTGGEVQLGSSQRDQGSSR